MMTVQPSASLRSLYLSDWQPKGVRKAWEKTSIGADTASKFLGEWTFGQAVSEAVGWFDPQGSMRVLVAKLADGRHVDLRCYGKKWSLSFPTVTP